MDIRLLYSGSLAELVTRNGIWICGKIKGFDSSWKTIIIQDMINGINIIPMDAVERINIATSKYQKDKILAKQSGWEKETLKKEETNSKRGVLLKN